MAGDSLPSLKGGRSRSLRAGALAVRRRSPELMVPNESRSTGGIIMPKRERIDHDNAKRYIRRDERGRFTSDQVAVGQSLTVDRRTRANRTVPKGQGNRGDQARNR
jgi:hypothetical protein